jgi:hypothetical protein
MSFAMDLTFDPFVEDASPKAELALGFVPLLAFASCRNAAKVLGPLMGALMLNTIPC